MNPLRRFDASSTTDDVLAGVDLRGQRLLVTGASSGLGREAARALAAAGAEVVMAARDGDKLAAVVEELKAATGNAALHALTVDLASLASVRAFADVFLARFGSLNGLINNAGVMACPLARTADGFEMQFGTNHLGHFLLTGLLLPALKAGAPARVVNLSSGGHKYGPVDFDDPNWEKRDYQKWLAYGASKTANALHALALDARYRDSGIRAFAVHPGVIFTDLARHLTPEDFKGFESGEKRGPLTIKSMESGAATEVWAATAPELAGRGGLYLEDCGIAEQVDAGVQTHGYLAYAQDAEAAERLWHLSERLTGWQA